MPDVEFGGRGGDHRRLEVSILPVGAAFEIAVGAADGVADGLFRERADHVVLQVPDGIRSFEQQHHASRQESPGVALAEVLPDVSLPGLGDGGVGVGAGHHVSVGGNELVGEDEYALRHQRQSGVSDQPSDDAARSALENAVRSDQGICQFIHSRFP